jgi:type II secretory pathway pseudopilin PulG
MNNIYKTSNQNLESALIQGCRCSPGKGEKGMSLLEVLLSIVFMAGILLMSLNFMVAGIRGNARGREMSSAAYFAQEMLEEMRMVDYTNLTDFDGYETIGDLPVGEPARSICLEWKQGIISELPSGYGEIDIQASSNIARIIVIVEWVDGVKKERQVKYETMISRRI